MNAGVDYGFISQTQISIVHTIFNIATTVLLFPISNFIVKLAKKISKVDDTEVDEGKALLDDRMLETPAIAIQSAMNEAVRMGTIVERSIEVVKSVLFTKKAEEIKALREDETTVDKLCGEISNYVIKLSTLQISEQEHAETVKLLQVLSDVERVSDYCENVAEFAETLVEKKISFSEIGRQHLEEIMNEALASYTFALEAFRDNDRDKALRVIEKETIVDDMEVKLRNQHIKRLTNNECNTEAGIIFLDMLVVLERISDHARNIAEEVLKV